MAVEQQSVSYWIIGDGGKAADLQSLQQKIFSVVFPLAKDHIWQQEPFGLTVKDHPVGHLFGKTNFGLNIDDEWFIVSLLVEISKVIPSCAIHVSDTDGDFLLIEAADFLPKWLIPEVANNRVFIHQGKIHIIPAKGKLNDPSWPQKISSIYEGADIVRRNPSATLADSDVQKCLTERLNKLSGDPQLFSHSANCLLPTFLAVLLDSHPDFVSPAVRSFCNRSPSDLRMNKEQRRFDPKSLVMTRVRFTKCLFAQIHLDPFTPDAKIWQLPPRDNPAHKASLLGAKLTLGFEIMCAKGKNGETPPGLANGTNDIGGSQWKSFVNSLKDRGYFQDYIEGSKDYQRLLGDAKVYFHQQLSPHPLTTYSNPGAYLLSLMESQVIECNAESFQLKSKNLSNDDDVSWLPVTAEDLDEMDANGSIKLSSHRKTFPVEAKKQLTQEVNNFLSRTGTVEGVEVPKKSESRGKPVTFDVEEFQSSVAAMLSGKKCEAEDNDSSDMESYSDDDFDVDLSENGIGEVKKFADSMKKYMSEMDKELQQTTLSKSFNDVKSPRSRLSKSPGGDSIDLESDEFQPVNIDNNLVSNMLESFWSEQGASGPASSMLHGLKVKLPHGRVPLDSDDEDQLEETLQKL